MPEIHFEDCRETMETNDEEMSDELALKNRK